MSTRVDREMFLERLCSQIILDSFTFSKDTQNRLMLVSYETVLDAQEILQEIRDANPA